MDPTRSLAQHHGQPSLSASGEILGLVWIPQDRRGAEVGRLEGINQSLAWTKTCCSYSVQDRPAGSQT